MRGSRRFSQAISEGDGISVLALADDAEAARGAHADGAEGIVVGRPLAGLREATDLPVLWRGAVEAAREADADACVLAVEGHEDEDGRLERMHDETLELGLDCVVAVRDEDELQLALDRLDPEIFLLSGRANGNGDELEGVLGLLPDVPAGKLAVADLAVSSADQVAELERAGVDAVIVPAADVARFVGDAHGP